MSLKRFKDVDVCSPVNNFTCVIRAEAYLAYYIIELVMILKLFKDLDVCSPVKIICACLDL